jgi:DNA-binding MarR family transcriptional regulator
MEKRFENFTIAILKLNKLVQKIKLYEMKEYDLKAIHVMCIYYLYENASGLTASELSKLTLEDKAAISRALNLLQERGYVKYDSNTYSAIIKITDEGKKIATYIADKANAAVTAGGSSLSDEEREIFYKALSSIARNLEEYYNGLAE